ncbi:alpha/beta fold hydrolase [Gallaecimonas kandeliae]|uniref:alpha/beta fold hydrolase n=1 Tax=Gallaecimonas kandeliae TaxID=3029055 RepID=UPI002649B951|nr:alpha/beta fold hydrolase [Gallaecimonas kandeliae]WKE66687.1 alpha/beta fold hydrolase [Gallaecimonas kandeliae]
MWLTEAELGNRYSTDIKPCFEGGAEGSMLALDGVPLHYRLFIPKGAETLVLLCTGRTESVFKYQELIFELQRQGIAVAALDHRGQGLSGRQTEDPHLGFVEDFQHYAEDLKQFVDQLVLPLGFKRHWLLAHSMGGCVAALYLERHGHPFEKVAMTSPMFSINTAPFPLWVARGMARWQSQQDKRKGRHRYVPTAGPFKKPAFDENGVSHSRLRFDLCQHWLEVMPDARLGGPSAQWLHAAFQAMDEAVAGAGAIQVPVLVVAAGEDKVVSLGGQRAFVDALPLGELHQMAGAWHELLLESDAYRQPTLDLIWQFFQG